MAVTFYDDDGREIKIGQTIEFGDSNKELYNGVIEENGNRDIGVFLSDKFIPMYLIDKQYRIVRISKNIE